MENINTRHNCGRQHHSRRNKRVGNIPRKTRLLWKAMVNIPRASNRAHQGDKQEQMDTNYIKKEDINPVVSEGSIYRRGARRSQQETLQH